MGLRHPWANKTAAGTRDRPTGGLGTKQGGGLEGFGEKRVMGEEVIIPRYITGLVIQRVFSWMEAFPSPLPHSNADRYVYSDACSVRVRCQWLLLAKTRNPNSSENSMLIGSVSLLEAFRSRHGGYVIYVIDSCVCVCARVYVGVDFENSFYIFSTISTFVTEWWGD